MTLEIIRKKNSHKVINEINDKGFSRYGRILHTAGAANFVEYVTNTYEKPKKGSAYIVDIDGMHGFPVIDEIKRVVYGEMEIECGICHGHNNTLMGLEYHQGSEVNIAVTDFILALAKKEDMKENTIASERLKLFYVPAGSVIELYESTLHYCPFSCNEDGFSCVVLLLDKTNTSIPYKSGELLVKRNKWFIAHENNVDKIAAGNVAGLLGEAITINI